VTCDSAANRRVILRRRIGSLWKIEREEAVVSTKLILGVTADPHQYTFFYQLPDGVRRTFGLGECYLLSTEVAGGYTGVYFGLYATGNGKRCLTPAYFDWFQYSILENDRANQGE